MRKILVLFFLLSILLFLVSCNLLHPFQNHYTCYEYKDAIYIMDESGNNVIQVVELGHLINTYLEFISALPGAYVQFSYDGSKLIYCNWVANQINLYSINSNGTGNTLLFEGIDIENSCGKPSISPIEEKVVFLANKDIYSINLDGTNLVNLTSTSEATEQFPCFLSNGQEIIFSEINYVFACTYYFIKRLNINNGNLGVIATNCEEYAYRHLTLSPDGTKLYFGTYIDHSHPFFIMNSDGTNQAMLYDNINFQDFLSISPDGSKIIYSYYDLFKMNTDGTGITHIETSIRSPRFPTLVHDGSQILFSDSAINDSIYIINTDGSNKMTIHEGFMPALSPNENKIAFSGYYFYKTIDYWE